VNETESTGETDWLLLYRVDSWLPLLLSEPELVAGLPEELRLSVLTPRERAVMRLGEACVWRAQVITDPEAMYNEKLVSAARVNVEDALADARALSTEVGK